MLTQDVVVVGAGPAGLAAAIAARKAGLSCQVLEKGALVNSILHFPTNMVFFTTPELLEIGGLPLVTPYEKPTRVEALRYYRRVADTFELAIELGEEVTAVRRQEPPGVLAVETRSRRGLERVWPARSVVLATGAYDLPNLIGVPGEDLPHVSHYYREPHPHYRQHVVVVGGKNSAAEAALDLYRHGARVSLVHRGARLGDSIKYWVLPDIENRIKEGAITARFESRVVTIDRETVTVEHHGEREVLAADAVYLLTGYHSDTTLFARAGIQFDPASYEPAYDPRTFETGVPGIFLAGAVVTGKNSGRIFIENGRLHGQLVIDVIAQRLSGRPVGP